MQNVGGRESTMCDGRHANGEWSESVFCLPPQEITYIHPVEGHIAIS